MSKIQAFEIKLYDWAYSLKLDRQQLPAIAQIVHTFSKEFSSAQLPELIVLKDGIAQWGTLLEQLLANDIESFDKSEDNGYWEKHDRPEDQPKLAASIE